MIDIPKHDDKSQPDERPFDDDFICGEVGFAAARRMIERMHRQMPWLVSMPDALQNMMVDAGPVPEIEIFEAYEDKPDRKAAGGGIWPHFWLFEKVDVLHAEGIDVPGVECETQNDAQKPRDEIAPELMKKKLRDW